MTDEEKKQRFKDLTRRNLIAQLATFGYELNGNPKDIVEVVRCKVCTHAEHCEIYAGWDGQNPEWYCGDGKRRDGSAQVSDRVPGRMGHHGDCSEDKR